VTSDGSRDGSGRDGGGLADQVAGWPVAASVAVVCPDGVVASAGPPERVRPWASVTKLVTALAVLVAVEEGSVALDDPAGPPGSTVAHLLAHASGLAPDGDRVLAAPGTRRIYSNRGFDVLGAVVAAATGMDFADYLHAGVLAPLAMTATRFSGSPAAGAVGPLTDLVALAQELLNPTLLSRATLRSATGVAFAGLDGVLPGFGLQRPNDWGLGFEVRGAKSPHWTGTRSSPATFGHFGRSGSFVWVDADRRLACVELADADFGPWAAAAWPVLTDGIVTGDLLAGGAVPGRAG
jgi:CubicO group peptidase (beta-lactamase class C family)